MIEAVFTTGVDEITAHGLTQWDKGQKLKITLSSLPASFEVHFAFKRSETAYVVDATASNGIATVSIPNAILRQPADAMAWIYIINGDAGETVKTIHLPIERRTKPADYVYEEADVANFREIVNQRIDEYIESGVIVPGVTVEEVTKIKEFTIDQVEFEHTGNPVQFESFSGCPLNCVTHIEPVQAGSGDPSPSNVRPISGYTGAKLVRCGKNLVDKNNVMELNAYFNTTLTTITSNVVNRTLYVRCKPNTTYYVTHASNAGVFHIGYTKEKPKVGSEVYGASDARGIYRTGADAEYIVCRYYHVENSSATQGEVLNAMQIEEGDAQTSIEHNAKTFTATFGQTVCGGTLDWDKGLLTVTQVRKVVNTISDSDGLAVRTNSVRFYVSGYGDYASGDTSRLVSKCNRLVYKNVYSNDDVGFQISEKSGGNIIVSLPISAGTTASAVRTWLANNPLEFAVVLPTPTTIQLTPAYLTALQGMNNIFCDAGETTVSGRKDILWLTDYLLKRVRELESAVATLQTAAVNNV